MDGWRAVTSADERDAVLLALIEGRPAGTSVSAALAEVRDTGDVFALWHNRNASDLFGSRSDDSVLEKAAADVASWRRQGYQFVSFVDDSYPARLREVYDAPAFLFYRGRLGAVGSGGVSLVGSRKASDRGVSVAREVARYLVRQNIPVLSGLAYGIDAAAHEETLAAGGTPVGVIASGIAAPYTPAGNRPLHQRVADAGALVSQFFPEAPARKHTFLQRNATMSGLGSATIVVEAGEHSGARAQARLAMEHGRPVLLTDSVVTSTAWGHALADGTRANVHVVSSIEDVDRALSSIWSMSQPATIERLLISSLQ